MTRDELRLFCQVHDHPTGWIKAGAAIQGLYYHLVYSYTWYAIDEFNRMSDIRSGGDSFDATLKAAEHLRGLPIYYVNSIDSTIRIGYVGLEEDLKAKIVTIMKKYNRVIT